MTTKILSGTRVPDVQLVRIDDNEFQFISTASLFADGPAIIIGIPGAFTPVCHRQHVPDFVAHADELRASGYGLLACIAPNDPFVLQMWSRTVDPQGNILFLSDGNLDWTNAVGLARTERKLCLGMRSERYMMNITNGVIQRLRVEPGMMDFTCTRAQDALTPLD